MGKIVNDDEVKRWFSEGRTYQWMVDEYARKYDVQISTGAFSNFRVRFGLERRIARNQDLMPWAVLPEHRYDYNAQMLRAEARRRAGMADNPAQLARLDAWLEDIAEAGVVVQYSQRRGFTLVPRRPGEDLIRVPSRIDGKHARD